MNQSVQVSWDAAYFNRATAVRVLDPASLTTQFTAADPADQFLAPHADQEAGTEVIRTRVCCFLPPRYVPHFMDAPVELRVAWMMLRGAIIQDGISVACLPLIRFLQAAVTVTSDVAGALPALALAAAPTAPLADHALIQHHINILHEDFLLNVQTQVYINEEVIGDNRIVCTLLHIQC